ncbi:hypothetical protein LINPERPRIM_LOCUS18278 [Linum perenne]
MEAEAVQKRWKDLVQRRLAILYKLLLYIVRFVPDSRIHWRQ